MEQAFVNGKYKVNDESFEYLGHVEPLINIADLEVVEASLNNKLIAGATLSFWGVLFSFFPGSFLTIFVPKSIDEPQLVVSLLCVLVFFILGFALRAKYRLIVTKASGNKGSIGKNRTSREEFDKLILALKESMSRNL